MEKELIKSTLTRHVAEELAIAPADVDEDASFMRLGISSVQALKVVNRLRRELDLDINPVALFEFKTIEDISDYLSQVDA